jgi:hypothetical protein
MNHAGIMPNVICSKNSDLDKNRPAAKTAA